MTQKKTPIIISIVLILAVAGFLTAAFIVITKDDSPQPSSPQNQVAPETKPSDDPLAFDKKRYSIDDPTSLWIVSNKQRVLPATFAPANLTTVSGSQQMQSDAAQALQKLIAAANKDGVSLRAVSAYRSFGDQQRVYNAYVTADGQAKADTYSARPGYSEHQTGLAVDVGNGSGQCDLEICFGTTAGGKWVAEHAHTYGFIIRYLEDKTQVTGYQYEPWHVRYVGVDLANELRNNHQTMEEFFGLPAAPGY